MVAAATAMVSLGDLCTFVRGASPTLKTPPGIYPLVVTASYRRTSATWQLEGPAVCIPLISSTGHGHAAIHRVHYQEGRFALANLLVALLPKDERQCDARFLYHYLTAAKDRLLVPLMQGTANVSLKEEDIARVTITLPPLEEQRRIVARLSKLAAAVAKATSMRNQQEDELRQMLLSAFHRIADGAPHRSMREVAPIIRRPVRVVPHETYAELGVRSFGKGTFHKPPVSGLEIGNKRVFYIRPGDLIFTNVFAWEGAVAVATPQDADRIASYRFITCVGKLASATFLRFYFLTSEGLMKIGAASPGGAGRNRTLSLEGLANIQVPVPPPEQQRWFDALQERVAQVVTTATVAQTQVEALLPSILDRTFKEEAVRGNG